MCFRVNSRDQLSARIAQQNDNDGMLETSVASRTQCYASSSELRCGGALAP